VPLLLAQIWHVLHAVSLPTQLPATQRAHAPLQSAASLVHTPSFVGASQRSHVPVQVPLQQKPSIHVADAPEQGVPRRVVRSCWQAALASQLSRVQTSWSSQLASVTHPTHAPAWLHTPDQRSAASASALPFGSSPASGHAGCSLVAPPGQIGTCRHAPAEQAMRTHSDDAAQSSAARHCPAPGAHTPLRHASAGGQSSSPTQMRCSAETQRLSNGLHWYPVGQRPASQSLPSMPMGCGRQASNTNSAAATAIRRMPASVAEEA